MELNILENFSTQNLVQKVDINFFFLNLVDLCFSKNRFRFLFRNRRKKTG